MAQQTTDVDIEAELARFEAAERARLGLDGTTSHWTDSMVDPMFTAKQRPTTTLLVGGLTMAHDYLVEATLKGLGYNVRALDVPDTASLRFGKEFGNKAQCNPTQFTVGNLVKELVRLRDEEGLSSREIIDNYVFMTAGACGPCRFGMYITEYRKALRDAGFEGFRVLLFQHAGNFKQATGEELGLVLAPPFFFALAKALFSGDVINLMAYRLRPYEVEPGAVDRALSEVKGLVYEALSENKSVLRALWRGRRIFERLELDRTQGKPKVSILGEFWAMTTEGDGNYFLQRFIEQEGGENDIQTIGNLVLYSLWEARHDTLARAELRGADGGPYGLKDSDVGLTIAGVWIGELALRAVWQTFAKAIGLHSYKLANMDEIAEIGHGHYNVELRGGEGHLEVAKLILNVLHQKTHMTLSVKPFGCMPSSGVSDGVQSAITELYPDAIFCPVETSGDGAVNFHSRVQMYLFKARQRAQKELEETLQAHGVTREQVRDYLRKSRYGSPLFKAPHLVAGTAADLVHHVGPLIGKGPIARAQIHARRAAERARALVRKDVPRALRTAGEIAPHMPALLRFAATEGVDMVPGLKKAYDTVLQTLVRPTEEAQRSVAEAEAQQARAAKRLPLAEAPEAAE